MPAVCDSSSMIKFAWIAVVAGLLFAGGCGSDLCANITYDDPNGTPPEAQCVELPDACGSDSYCSEPCVSALYGLCGAGYKGYGCDYIKFGSDEDLTVTCVPL